MLIDDDKQDIGYTTYRGRTSHRYHGEIRPDHPSPFHHYQAGLVLCGVGNILGVLDTLQEVQKSMIAAELPQLLRQKPLIPVR
jgi:hypothetical protein